LDRDTLEDRLGFHKGRLDHGAVVAVMFEPDLNKLATTDFTLGASTRWSRSRSSAPWAPEYAHGRNGGRMEPNAVESAKALEGSDVQALKKKVLAFMKRSDGNAPAKVFPFWLHEKGMEYPDAEVGLPQFQLHNKVNWVVTRVMLAKSGAV
jgi:hypothetical protein